MPEPVPPTTSLGVQPCTSHQIAPGKVEVAVLAREREVFKDANGDYWVAKAKGGWRKCQLLKGRYHYQNNVPTPPPTPPKLTGKMANKNLLAKEVGKSLAEKHVKELLAGLISKPDAVPMARQVAKTDEWMAEALRRYDAMKAKPSPDNLPNGKPAKVGLVQVEVLERKPPIELPPVLPPDHGLDVILKVMAGAVKSLGSIEVPRDEWYYAEQLVAQGGYRFSEPHGPEGLFRTLSHKGGG